MRIWKLVRIRVYQCSDDPILFGIMARYELFGKLYWDSVWVKDKTVQEIEAIVVPSVTMWVPTGFPSPTIKD